MSKMLRARLAFAASMLMGAGGASAYTECTVVPSAVFAGDEGTFYIVYADGGSGVIASSDPDFKQTVALVTAAMLADKQLDVRYAADGASCTSGQQYVIGVRLYR